MGKVIQLYQNNQPRRQRVKNESMKNGLIRRGKYYHYVRRINGRRVKRSTGQTTRELAMAWVQKNILTPEKQAQTGLMLQNDITFSDFVEKHYLRHIKIHRAPSTYASYVFKLKPFLAYCGNYKLNEITSALIDEYKYDRDGSPKKGAVQWKGETIKGITINKEIGAVRSAINFAINKNFLRENPATSKKVERFDEDEYEPHFISEEDFNQKFLPVANPRKIPNLTELYLFTLYLGLRKNEALGLKWADVDFSKRIVTFRRPKNNRKQKKNRKVPLSHFIYSLLKSIRHNIRSEFVFPNPNGTRRKTVLEGFKRVLKRAGLPNMRYHDLRHSFVSMCAAKDISWDKTSLITGHKSYQMYQRYRHFFDKTAREVVDQFQAPTNYNLKD